MIFVICLFILGLYAFVGFFAHPSGDDFDYACLGRTPDFINTVLHERIRWNGRYISNFLVIGSPLNVGGITLYQTMPTVLIFGILSCLTLSMKLLDIKHFFLFSCILLTLTLSILPDITEGIYWYTGAISYIPGGALFILSLSLLYSHWNTSSPIAFIAIFPIQLIASGFNEIIPILSAATFGILYLYHLKNWKLFVLFIFQLCLFYYVISAPGNNNRADLFTNNHELFRSLYMSAAYSVRFLGEWLLNPAVYCLAILALFIKNPFQLSFFTKPLIVFFSLVGPVFLAAFGPLWSTGLLGQYRTANLAAFLFIPTVFIVMITNQKAILSRLKLTKLPRYTLLILGISLLLWKNQFFLLKELASGEIFAFDEEMQQRYRLLENSFEKDVYLPPIKNKTKTLFVYPLLDDHTSWNNQSYGNYFRTFKVHLKKD